MGCFQSTQKKQFFRGYENPVLLASQTAFGVSKVEALFELFKSISGSVIDDGLINKPIALLLLSQVVGKFIFAFLEQMKGDFNKKYVGGKVATTAAKSFNK